MKTVRELRKKAASRKGLGKQVLSTSEARANFAEALESAQVSGAVIGFDRYGRTIAALVPVEAIYMLAGMTAQVAPAVRASIAKQAKAFVENVPSHITSRPAAKAPAKKGAAKSAKKKAASRRRDSGRR